MFIKANHSILLVSISLVPVREDELIRSSHYLVNSRFYHANVPRKVLEGSPGSAVRRWHCSEFLDPPPYDGDHAAYGRWEIQNHRDVTECIAKLGVRNNDERRLRRTKHEARHD